MQNPMELQNFGGYIYFQTNTMAAYSNLVTLLVSLHLFNLATIERVLQIWNLVKDQGFDFLPCLFQPNLGQVLLTDLLILDGPHLYSPFCREE